MSICDKLPHYSVLSNTHGYPENTYICITFVQRLPNVFDVGPTLYKCYTNVLRLLGCADKYVITMSDWIDWICLNPFSVGSSPGIFPDAKTA